MAWTGPWSTSSFPFPTTLLLTLASLTDLTEAALPFHSTIARAALKKSGDVTFDPLGVIAILSNPRASASAARLYTQPDISEFRWPHMLQVGAALIPVSMLVKHLTADYKSIHPAVDMCKDCMDTLDVKANIVQLALFDTLPLNMSNQWLTDTLSFQPSRYAGNDFVIVNIHNISGTGAYSGQPEAGHQRPRTNEMKRNIFLILLAECGMGLVVFVGIVFSVLLGDIWGIVLFLTYAIHWIASTLLSFSALVVPDPSLRTVPSEQMNYAVYERPSGGAVIFMGKRDIMEQWARTNWVFTRELGGDDDDGSERDARGSALPAHQQQQQQQQQPPQDAVVLAIPQQNTHQGNVINTASLQRPLAGEKAPPPRRRPQKARHPNYSPSFTRPNVKHWFWMLSGSVAAVASVACMVNMGGIMQLGFLGMLVYASVAEILITLLARKIQVSSHDPGRTTWIQNHDKRYKSIIEATIGVEKEFRTVNLNWIEFGLLPRLPPFEAMLSTLAYLNTPKATIERARGRFDAACPEPTNLSKDVWREIKKAWKKREGTRMVETASIASVDSV